MLPCRWPWEVRNPRRQAWTASAGGIRSPSEHAAASSPASAVPRGPHPWGTPRASPASASARCAALSDCCSSSPALPAKGKTRCSDYHHTKLVWSSSSCNVVARELVMRSITLYLAHDKTTSAGRARLPRLVRLLCLPRSGSHCETFQSQHYFSLEQPWRRR